MENILDELYEELTLDIQKMSKKIIINHSNALEALLNNNNKKALSVIENDDVINQMEEMINQKVVIGIAKYQPVASDLRKLIGILKLSADIERIGDYAKSIAKVTITKKQNFTVSDEHIKIIKEMQDTFIHLFTETLVAFKNLDDASVYDIVKEDEKINDLLDTALDIDYTLLKTQEEFENYMLYINLLRKIERAGDHTKNICETIVYVTTGTRIEL